MAALFAYDTLQARVKAAAAAATIIAADINNYIEWKVYENCITSLSICYAKRLIVSLADFFSLQFQLSSNLQKHFPSLSAASSIVATLYIYYERRTHSIGKAISNEKQQHTHKKHQIKNPYAIFDSTFWIFNALH